MKLNPEELVVDSFDTEAQGAYSEFRPATDPTPDTGCFDCPILVSDGCY